MELLRVEELTYAYTSDDTVLDGITFSIREGETVALVGPNGAGKSTLLLCIAGILPASGKVRVGDVDLTDREGRAAMRKVGILFQDPDDQLFLSTVLDDVAFGPLNLGASPQKARSIAEQALEAVGMSFAKARSPDKLSAGERKRVALAGVLAMKPDLLLLDEPSSGLDPRSRRQLIRLLSALPESKLIATHDLYLVRDLCERMLVMDGGRIVASGPTREILTHSDLLQRHGLEFPDQALY
ncbi:MAG: ABC transporter ATP-binding protein [Fimbriimonadia bacterium]|jgi:cobalt/nickel transport system ATP-binding protein